jgi:hypothetical protein
MYIIYAGEKYYPKGGANDIVGYYDTYDLSLEHYNLIIDKYDWIHILNTENKKIVNRKS